MDVVMDVVMDVIVNYAPGHCGFIRRKMPLLPEKRGS